MDLPTYTSIWRIEKRLYKLYDFRLPMPVPVGQIAVFAAITVPYVILLTILGLPFNHTLFWLYVLPPGVITWLATRPVLESKRLPELIISQVRYLGEPGTWVRMAPLAEKDDVVVIGKVWRRDEERYRAPAEAPALAPAAARRPAPAQVRPAEAPRGRPPLDSPPRPPRPARRPGCRVPLRRRVRGAGTSEAVLLSGRRPRLARRGRRPPRGRGRCRPRSPTTSGRPRTARRQSIWAAMPPGPRSRPVRRGRPPGTGKASPGRGVPRRRPRRARLPHHGRSRTRTPLPRW